MVSQGEAGEGEKDWECVVSKYKPWYVGWMDHKVVLYSTGNYSQCPVMNHNGKEYIKK